MDIIIVLLVSLMMSPGFYFAFTSASIFEVMLSMLMSGSSIIGFVTVIIMIKDKLEDL